MSTPEILYRNLLSIAADGRGDGTIYAKGTGATPVVANKTFDITAGYTEMADLTPGNDLHNGAQLVFTVSGRSYLITDWVTATELATVYETPNAEDTGAWTIRRALYTDDFNVANPVRFGVNGRLYQKWIDKAANNTATIQAGMPNAIDDGGFELNSLTDFWATRGVAGTGEVTVEAASLLGGYDCHFNQGDQTFVGIEQVGKIILESGKTYGIIFKSLGAGGSVTDLRVSLEFVTAGDTALIPTTFTKINVGDDTTAPHFWKPAITVAIDWDEVKFTVSDTVAAESWKLVIDQHDATDAFIDEIYIFEVISPNTFIAGGHNMAGGFATGSHVRASRTQNDLSSYSSDEYEDLIDLDADVTGNSDPIYETFTATTSIYPIMEINLAAVASKTWEAAEIWIGKRWTWEKYPNSPLTGKQRKIESTSAKARGGPVQSDKIYQQAIISSTQDLVDSSEVDVWVDFIETSGHGKPFWLRVQTAAGLGVTAHTIFCRCASVPDIQEDPPVFYTASFSFEEAF